MKDVLSFLYQLTRNNDREWFQENKDWYNKSYSSVENLVSKLIQEVNVFDKSVGAPNPKKLIFRIYRDSRFSANKDPYKTNFGAVICPEEFKSVCNYASYYVHIENDKCFVSTGIYMPDSPSLKSIREAIDINFNDFKALVNQKSFVKEFDSMIREEDSLKRPPAGFSKDSPAIEYLKMKNFYVFKNITNTELISDNFISEAVDIFKLSMNFKNWINKAVCNQV